MYMGVFVLTEISFHVPSQVQTLTVHALIVLYHKECIFHGKRAGAAHNFAPHTHLLQNYSVHIVLVYIEVHSLCSSTERFLALVGQSLEVKSRSLHLV